MSECRRCGAEISPADVQKGRALQRGEFWYCPTCVADARAAKAGSPAGSGAPASSRGSAVALKPAPASGAHRAPASGVLKAPPSSGAHRAPAAVAQRSPASGAVPGLKSAPPPSSTKMKPVPAPASRKVAVPPPQQPLLDEDSAEDEAPPPGRTPARGGPASGRHGKPGGGPASSRIRKSAPPPEDEAGASGSLRKKIGFKDGSAGVAPMSKSTLMMWAVVGGIFFAIAGGLFFTVIIKRGRENKAYKENAEICKQRQKELDRLLREKPKDFEAIDEALKKFEEVAAKDPKFQADLEEFTKLVNRRKEHHKLKKMALEELSGIAGALATVEGTDEGLRRAKKAMSLVKSVEWVLDEQKEYQDRLLTVLKAAKAAGETAKAATPQDWILIAGCYVIASTISAALPPEVFSAQDAGTLQKDAEDAVAKRYDDPVYLAKFAWEDIAFTDFKEFGLTVAVGADGLNVQNNTAEVEFLLLNKPVSWQDFTLRLEFTAGEEGFVIFQRQAQGEGATPAVQHDIKLMMSNGAIKPGEKITVDFMVFGGKFRIGKEMKFTGNPGRCAPSGSKQGGFSFRVAGGAKLTVHKVQVQVYQSEEEPAKK
ncbi:MAG: hypothetical protein AAB074_07550 [Planctomycetota bacterium]